MDKREKIINDLPDGPNTKETYMNIFKSIIGTEMIKLECWGGKGKCLL